MNSQGLAGLWLGRIIMIIISLVIVTVIIVTIMIY